MHIKKNTSLKKRKKKWPVDFYFPEQYLLDYINKFLKALWPCSMTRLSTCVCLFIIAKSHYQRAMSLDGRSPQLLAITTRPAAFHCVAIWASSCIIFFLSCQLLPLFTVWHFSQLLTGHNHFSFLSFVQYEMMFFFYLINYTLSLCVWRKQIAGKL